MFLTPLRALRIENLPPPSPFIGVEQEGKSSFLVMGWLQTMLSCFSTPSSEGYKRESFIRKLRELSRKPNPICIFKWVELLILVPTPNPLFPQESKPQDKTKPNKKLWGSLLLCSPPPFFPSFLLFLFVLEPSEKHQGTEVSTLSYDRSLVL